MERPDKSARKARLKAWRESENQNARSLYPLANRRLEEFFGALESLRFEHGCFHDLRHSLQVIESMGLSGPQTECLLDWCNDHGGHCDCEIAANTFMHWRETRGQA